MPLQGLHHATPLFPLLALVEASDLVFALDAIPAILAVTGDPFIVFTSNIFAILVFTGARMLLLDVLRIQAGIAPGVVGLTLAAAVAANLLTSKTDPPRR